MPEQLTQSQIDLLLNKMSSGDEVEVKEDRKIRDYDFTSPKKFTKEQLKALDSLHETFSRMLASFLSGLVRSGCSAEVLQIEELRYYEYNNALSDNALIGILDFKPAEEKYSETTLIMDMSTAMGFYLVERLLGGNGNLVELSRDYTEIELSILANVFGKISDRLQDTWNNNLDVSIGLNSLETNSRLLQVFHPDDIVVAVVFSIKIGALEGTMSLLLPADSIEEYIDTFSGRYVKVKRQDPEKELLKKNLVTENVFETDMEIQAVFGEISMDLSEILDLQPMDIIPLGKSISEDILIKMDNLPWFNAKLGETKNKKSVKLTNPHN